jgi:hypothetical protein
LSRITGVTEITENGVDEGILKISLSCGKGMDFREEIYKEIKKQTWILMEFYHEVQTLEKVFRDLTRENGYE